MCWYLYYVRNITTEEHTVFWKIINIWVEVRLTVVPRTPCPGVIEPSYTNSSLFYFLSIYSYF